MEDRIIENKAYRMVLLGIGEIIGENGLKSVLNYSGLAKYIDNLPPDNDEKTGAKISEIARLCEAVEDIFGKRGSRALLLLVGKRWAKWGLDINRDVTEAAQAHMAGMSEVERARIMLNYTANAISKQLDTEAWIEEGEGSFLFKDKAATYCFNRKSDEPVCYTTEGFMAEIVAWAVGNHSWKVREESCMSMGEPYCCFRIFKE
jgi:predicted hydrocarbon binding protein